MARAPKSGAKRSRRARPASAALASRPDQAAIDAFLDNEGFGWLKVPNVIGITVAEKERGGQPTGELAVKFDVIAKLSSRADVARAESRPIPEFIDVGGHLLPTDVVEAWPEAHPANAIDRRVRIDPVRGGVSIGTLAETGTLGAIVWDKASGRPVALSNWHVLTGRATDSAVFQPGSLDLGGGAETLIGRRLGMGVLNRNVDAAVASVDFRLADAAILELGVEVRDVVRPARGMRVAKSGRTTEVTHGIVENPRKLVAIDIGLPARHNIAVCVIEPDPARPAPTGLSAGGDSGSCWMLVGNDGRATGTMVGLHVGGDGPGTAYACHADQVFAALGLEPLAGRAAPPGVKSLQLPSPLTSGPARTHRVIARRGLAVRAGPDTSFARFDGRLFGETVNVIDTRGDWLMVDLEGDGRADGFMFGAFLEPILD